MSATRALYRELETYSETFSNVNSNLCSFNTGLVFAFAVMAASAIANIVKSSLGPVGLDKMLVDDIGVCITSSSINHVY